MKLAAESAGSGVPLVFLHAFPLSRRMWDRQRKAFAKNFRFITVDLPGFGESSLSGNTSKMSDMASHVLETLDSLGVKEKFVVAGLSMGGYVMLQILKQAPERIRAACFFSTRSGADSAAAREKRQKNIEFVQKEGSRAFAARMLPSLVGSTSQVGQLPVLKEIVEWISVASPEAIAAALRGMADRPDMTNVINSMRFPALFIAGAEDTVIAPSEMETLSSQASKSEFHIISAAGHLLNLEQPGAFEEIFLKFLKRHVL